MATITIPSDIHAAIKAGEAALRQPIDPKWAPVIELGMRLATAHDREAHSLDEVGVINPFPATLASD